MKAVKVENITIGAVIFTTLAVSALVWNCGRTKEVSSHYADPYPGKVERRFIPLPVGAVKPTGWLKTTLQTWANGITGHLYEYRSDTFWNTWDNRRHRNEHPKEEEWWPFEQQAYWADGLVRLAYILDDDRLRRLADEFVNKVLAGQNPDGYMGGWPDKPYRMAGDIYVQTELYLSLMSYYSATKDPRIINAMQKALRHIYANYEPSTDNAVSPVWNGENGWPWTCHIIDPILWVYSKTGDQQMMDLANLVYQTLQEVPSPFQSSNLLMDGDNLRELHGVDVTESMRTPAVYYLYSGNLDDLNASIKGIEKIDRYHGQVHGGPAADEFLREPGAVNNTEFCTHTTWSATKQTMFSITGEVKYADGVERLLFNAGPGAMTPNAKALQYFTAPNQVACTSTSCNSPISGPRSDLQYLRPDGNSETLCCVGESNRLYPNYVKDAMWLGSSDNGLAAVCYGPSTVSAKVGEAGKMVTIAEKTNYPFEEKIRFVIESSEPINFPIFLRIPGWCKDASIEINGKLYTDSVLPGRMVKIDRLWASGDHIDLHLPMRIHYSRWNKASVAVERGPLVYALKIKEHWQNAGERFPGFPDWEVRSASAWNYALRLSSRTDIGLEARPSTPDSFFTVNYPKVPDGSNPWEYPPIELIGKAKKVDGWRILAGDVTPDVPQSPIFNDNPEEDVTLVPYGSTRIRITYFPVAPPSDVNALE